jgi:hypothetical protein
MFEEARADIRMGQAELKKHVETNGVIIGDMRTQDAITMQKVLSLESKVDEVRK